MAELLKSNFARSSRATPSPIVHTTSSMIILTVHGACGGGGVVSGLTSGSWVMTNIHEVNGVNICQLKRSPKRKNSPHVILRLVVA